MLILPRPTKVDNHPTPTNPGGHEHWHTMTAFQGHRTAGGRVLTPTMRRILSHHPKYAVRFWHVTASISYPRRFRILVVGKVCPCDAQPNPCQINATLNPQKGSGKSSLINTVFKANLNIQVCDPSYFVFLTCQSDYIPETRKRQEYRTLITRFNRKRITILSFTRALDLVPAMARTCRPSEILSHIEPIPVVQLLKDYMPSGRESIPKFP